MEAIAGIGVDLAKSVFQVPGVDAQGKVVVRRRLSRAKLLPFFAKLPPCLVGMETWSALGAGTRPLMPDSRSSTFKGRSAVQIDQRAF